jgi:hypothetical protein
LLELAGDLRKLGVTSCNLCGVELVFGPIPQATRPLDAEDVVEMARAAVKGVAVSEEMLATWSA